MYSIFQVSFCETLDLLVSWSLFCITFIAFSTQCFKELTRLILTTCIRLQSLVWNHCKDNQSPCELNLWDLSLYDKFSRFLPGLCYWHKGAHQRCLTQINYVVILEKKLLFLPNKIQVHFLYDQSITKLVKNNLYQKFCDGMKWSSFEVWSLKAQHEAQIKWRTFAITSNVLNNLVSLVSLCKRQMEHYWLMGCSK